MLNFFRRLFADTQEDWVTDFVNQGNRQIASFNKEHAEEEIIKAQKRQARAGIAAIRREQEKKLFSYFFDQADKVSSNLLVKIERVMILIEERDEYIINGDEFHAEMEDMDIRPVIKKLEKLRDGILTLEREKQWTHDDNSNVVRIPRRA